MEIVSSRLFINVYYDKRSSNCEDLLKGIIIASGNDACVALAEGIAGSEENFADMMNEKRGEIGDINKFYKFLE